MDKQELKARLKEYTAIERLCGYESRMAYRFQKDMSTFTDDVRIDRIGNVIATFKGADADAPSIMIFAHMDTIGFVISSIDEGGFIKVERMGGVPEKAVQAIPVLVGTEQGEYVNGILASKAYHVQSPEDKSKVDSLSSLFIDIGVSSRKAVHDLGIQVGCPVTYAHHFMELQGDRVCATYLDDASGLVSLLHIASILSKAAHAATVYLVGTVWEEFNARGAMMAQRSAKADMAICLLGPGAGDTPDQKGINNVALGGGPGVTLFNFHGKGTLNGCIAHKGMFELLKESAESKQINLQRSAARGALSDTAYIQLEDGGIPCLDMGTPDRYSHSPMESLDLRDLEQTGILVADFIGRVTGEFDLNRY